MCFVRKEVVEGESKALVFVTLSMTNQTPVVALKCFPLQYGLVVLIIADTSQRFDGGVVPSSIVDGPESPLRISFVRFATST